MLEKHTVFLIIRVLSKEPMPYQFSTLPGEKCGLGTGPNSGGFLRSEGASALILKRSDLVEVKIRIRERGVRSELGSAL